MSHQLWYTSAERGLTPGSRGFCTVKATRGIPQPLAQRLESLSGYKHLFSPKANGNPDNPVAYHFIHLQQGGRTWYVLSRVCDAGLDYSGRTNKFAHHVVLDRDELPPAGPAWLMSQPGFFDEAWDGTVGIVDGRKPIARHDRPPAPCQRWQQAAGDAGWAGVLAESAIQTAVAPAHVIVPAHVFALPLLEEALALLPPEVRWSTTFSTFFTDQFPADVSPRWRVLIDGTREAARAAAIRHQPVINLTQRGPVPASIVTPSVEAARQGISLSPALTVAETLPHAEALSLSERAFSTRSVGPAGSPPPMSLRRAAPRPAESSPPEISRIAPIRTVTNYPTWSSARNVLLVTSLPLLLLGLFLGIAVQWRWPVLPLSKGKDVAAAGDVRQSSTETENQGKTTAGTGKDSGERPGQPSNAQKNATASKPGGQGANQEVSGQKNGAGDAPSHQSKNATKSHSSGADPGSEKESQQDSSESTVSQQGKTEPPQTSTASPGSGTTPKNNSSDILDATTPQWTVREINHPFSKIIKIVIIEKHNHGTDNGDTPKEPTNSSNTAPSVDSDTQSGNASASEPSYHLLIYGDGLIRLKPLPPLSVELAPPDASGSDKSSLTLVYRLRIPYCAISAAIKMIENL